MDKKKIKNILLIVEDDQVLLRALYLLFRKTDYIIATAADGETGLKMAERLKPSLILLDLLLPTMNGFDVLKYLKANPTLKDIPVIVLSNLGDTDSQEKVKALGVEDFFIKAQTDLTFLLQKVKEKIG